MEKQSFEQRLDQVGEIIAGIETGQLPLEESVRRYETGIRILNELDRELADMKRKITVLQTKPDGTEEETAAEEKL